MKSSEMQESKDSNEARLQEEEPVRVYKAVTEDPVYATGKEAIKRGGRLGREVRMRVAVLMPRCEVAPRRSRVVRAV